MKRIVWMGLFLPALMLLAPLPLLRNEAVAASANVLYTEIESPPPLASVAATDSFRVLDHKTGEITVMSAEDYICGVICGEMPLSFGDEAVKAQAVAAYTFACRRRQTNSSKDYDITTDYTVDQCFMGEEEARQKWGDSADESLTKIRELVQSVSGYMVTYEGNAALTVYHAASSGKTQDVRDVWGGELPYLCAVESAGDPTSVGFVSSVQLTADEMSEKLKNICTTSGEPDTWFGEAKRNSSDYVTQITVCSKTVSGSEIRAALELKSTCFEIDYFDGKFTVTVKGNGHGVGMSQNGAAAMAAGGSSFEEILCHYYSGCKVEKIL